MRTYSTYSDDYGEPKVEGMEEAQNFFMTHLEEVEDLLLGASALTEPEDVRKWGDRLQGLRLMADDLFGHLNSDLEEAQEKNK